MSTVLLPFAEEMKRKGTKDRTELSFLAIRVLIDNHVDLEDFAQCIPEVSWPRESSIVEQVLDLREVLIVRWE